MRRCGAAQLEGTLSEPHSSESAPAFLTTRVRGAAAAARRGAMRIRHAAACAALLLIAAVACCTVTICDVPQGVVVIVMDTTRADRCSFLGYARPTTPRLEEFARESAVWTNAWSPAPWTLPAHATLFTGLSPEQHRVGLDGRMHLDAVPPTLAERLGDAGWTTGCFSANPFVSREFGITRGFGTVRTFRGGAAKSPAAVVPPAPSSEVCGEALRWIRGHRTAGRRYFAYLNLMDAHSPYDPPERFAARFRRGSRDDAAAGEDGLRRLSQRDLIRASFLPETLSAAGRERLSDLYDADLAALDDEIGRFLDALRADGALDDALVVVLGDHGEGLGDHAWVEHATILNQEMLRVPLLVHRPGRFEPAKIDSVVTLEDVFATVIDVCGAVAVPGAEGVPLDAKSRPPFAFACEGAHPEWIPRISGAAPGADLSKLRQWRRSVTDGAHHLIVESTGECELYDLAADPLERTNVAGTKPDVLARLRAALDARPSPFR